MSPRPYDRRLRQAAGEEARRRIAEAAAELHAKHGPLATSHAMLAKRAGVSVPTVYKYFPTRDAVIPACVGWVAGRAPLVLDARIFEGAKGVRERVQTLARSVFRIHEHFAPWLRWGDAAAAELPTLRAIFEEGRKGRLELTRMALTPPGGRPPAESLVLVAHVLLEYPSWKTLTEAGNTSDQAATVVAVAILNLYRSPHR